MKSFAILFTILVTLSSYAQTNHYTKSLAKKYAMSTSEVLALKEGDRILNISFYLPPVHKGNTDSISAKIYEVTRLSEHSPLILAPQGRFYHDIDGAFILLNQPDTAQIIESKNFYRVDQFKPSSYSELEIGKYIVSNKYAGGIIKVEAFSPKGHPLYMSKGSSWGLSIRNSAEFLKPVLELDGFSVGQEIFIKPSLIPKNTTTFTSLPIRALNASKFVIHSLFQNGDFLIDTVWDDNSKNLVHNLDRSSPLIFNLKERNEFIFLDSDFTKPMLNCSQLLK